MVSWRSEFGVGVGIGIGIERTEEGIRIRETGCYTVGIDPDYTVGIDPDPDSDPDADAEGNQEQIDCQPLAAGDG